MSETPIDVSAMKLLLEASRLRNELPGIRGRLPDPDRAYQARTDQLEWAESQTVMIANEILAKLRSPRRLPDLVGEVPCSTFTLYRIAAELYETNQLA